MAQEGDGEQTQEESVEHTHGPGGTHTHAAADTIASGVALNAGSGQSWSGSATLLQVGDSVRILLSVERAPAETRYTAQLLAGSCEAPGAELASLTPVATGTSGRGSSQSTVPAARLEEHDHGALRLRAGDGPAAACAPVHPASSEHRHEQE